MCRATGSDVACSTPVGSTHIRWPCSNLTAAFARACDKRIAAETAAGEASFPKPCQVRGPDRLGPLATSASRRLPASVVKTHASASTASSRSGLSARRVRSGLESRRDRNYNEIDVACASFGEESVLLEHR